MILLRSLSGLTQKEVATVLGISQPSLSKIENQDDMQIGTLNKLIQALGGKLKIIADLPLGDCRLTQVREKVRREGRKVVRYVPAGQLRSHG